MREMKIIKNEEGERVFLVGINTRMKGELTTVESIKELAFLAKTVNAEVIGQSIVRSSSINPGYFISRNKALEIADICKEHDISTVIFNDSLTPSQQGNLEDTIEVKVIDRTNLILDIFAGRANTREGILQVELAQLDYLLPRLKGKGKSLMQQVGGIGVRGPGEKKLEYDKRKIRERINLLKKEIEKVREHRKQQRQKRQDNFLPIITLVGYTNAGKSTLLNNLSGSDVFVENKLFATLDPTTRRVTLPDNRKALFIDTVGLINKLPHQLVAAFRATLEEITYSDILVHVVDISHENYEEEISSVEKVLDELGNLNDKPVVFVFNKIDLLKDRTVITRLKKSKRKTVFVSAIKKQGFDELFDSIAGIIKKDFRVYKLRIPQARNDVVSSLYENVKIIKTDYQDNDVIIKAELNTAVAGQLKPYIIVTKRKRKK